MTMRIMKLVKILKLTIVMQMMMLKTAGQNNRQGGVPACKQGEASASDKSGTGGAS